jgi:hypothetical protein
MDDLGEDEINFVLDLIAHHCGGKRPLSVLTKIEMERIDFIKRFPLDEVPGNNPVTKAVRALKLLYLAEQYSRYVYINDLIAWMIMKLSKQLDDSDLSQLLSLAGGSGAGEEEKQQLAAEIEVQGVDVSELLRIARQLERTAEFQSPQGEFVPDPNGEDVNIRSIQGMNELSRVNQLAWALPEDVRFLKVFQEELLVREPVTRRDKKQLRYLMVDCSGSMSGSSDDRGGPVGRAAGVVLDSIQRVIEGKAEVYLRFFDTRLGADEYHADSPESARELMKVVTDPSNYGGGTSFVAPIREASERANELVREGRFHSPEVIMVTDGEGTVPDVSDLGGLKLHTVQVGEDLVPELAQLANASGGTNIDATKQVN